MSKGSNKCAAQEEAQTFLSEHLHLKRSGYSTKNSYLYSACVSTKKIHFKQTKDLTKLNKYCVFKNSGTYWTEPQPGSALKCQMLCWLKPRQLQTGEMD